MNESKGAPVSLERVQRCLESADFWEEQLGKYGMDARARADRWSWISVGGSTLTGLAVWSTLAASTAWPAVLIVSVVAFVSALAGAAPKIGRYEDTAKDAAALASRYGHVIGELTDVKEALVDSDSRPEIQTAARMAVASFEEVKKDKDALSPISHRLKRRLEELSKKRALSS